MRLTFPAIIISMLTVENNNIALMPIRADITNTIISVIPLRFNINHPIPAGQWRYPIHELKVFLE
jgi:hypothetical protein